MADAIVLRCQPRPSTLALLLLHLAGPAGWHSQCSVQGYMHAGGVLDPGVISNITAKAVRTEFSGKVSGATALVQAAGLANPLRMANLFSSLAAFSGSGGQGGYAAANGALDALAQDLQVSTLATRARIGAQPLQAWPCQAEGLAECQCCALTSC